MRANWSPQMLHSFSLPIGRLGESLYSGWAMVAPRVLARSFRLHAREINLRTLGTLPRHSRQSPGEHSGHSLPALWTLREFFFCELLTLPLSTHRHTVTQRRRDADTEAPQPKTDQALGSKYHKEPIRDSASYHPTQYSKMPWRQGLRHRRPCAAVRRRHGNTSFCRSGSKQKKYSQLASV